MNFKIDKDVPIPALTTRQGQNIQLLKAMKIGESVYFDAPIIKKAVRFYRVAKKLGIRVVIRKDVDGGMRMWRVEDMSGVDAASEAAVKGAGAAARKHAKDAMDRVSARKVQA